MYTYSLKYVDRELRKYGYKASPSTRMYQGFARQYMSGNMCVTVYYEGHRVFRLDLTDTDVGSASLFHYVASTGLSIDALASTGSNVLFKYANIPFKDFVRVVRGPANTLRMRLENMMNNKVIEELP